MYIKKIICFFFCIDDNDKKPDEGLSAVAKFLKRERDTVRKGMY
jgi:hypothetical protein